MHSKNCTNSVVQVDNPLLICPEIVRIAAFLLKNRNGFACSWPHFVFPEPPLYPPKKKVAAPIFYPDRAVAKSRLQRQMIASKDTKAAPQRQAMPTKQTALCDCCHCMSYLLHGQSDHVLARVPLNL